MQRVGQRWAALLAMAGLASIGCDSSVTGPLYEPVLPTAWASSVTNSFFVLVPGTTLRYQGQTPEGLETIVVEALHETRTVNGVVAMIVRDRVYLDGSLIEDTYDWYAQDAAGNVWYLGEDSREIENGRVVSTAGSWAWGVDGALPGIMMWANPSAHVGESYRQEYYKGEAEDWGKVTGVDAVVQVPYGRFTGCIQTEDWNALESGSLEHKYYCPQIGVVLEVNPRQASQRVELMTVTKP